MKVTSAYANKLIRGYREELAASFPMRETPARQLMVPVKRLLRQVITSRLRRMKWMP